MKYGVRIKLDVSKIDKTKLFRGQKGVYLDATVFIDVDQKDQYDNNGMITQDIPKAEKDAGQQGAILGNVQVFWSDGQQQAPQQQASQQNYQQAPQQAPQRAPQQQHQQSPNQNLPPANQYQQSQQQPQPAPNFDDFDDDIPFN